MAQKHDARSTKICFWCLPRFHFGTFVVHHFYQRHRKFRLFADDLKIYRVVKDSLDSSEFQKDLDSFNRMVLGKQSIS